MAKAKLTEEQRLRYNERDRLKYRGVAVPDNRRRPDFAPAVLAQARALEARWVVDVLPHVRKFAWWQLRRRPWLTWAEKEDFAANVVAVAWRRTLVMLEQGKDPFQYVRGLAVFSFAQVNAFKYVTGMESGQDAMSRRARLRLGFKLRLADRKAIDNWLDSPLLAG
jgi:hypothetical protein